MLGQSLGVEDTWHMTTNPEVRSGDAWDRFRDDSLAEYEWRRSTVNFLSDSLETGACHQFTKSAGGSVMDLPLSKRDADVVDEPTPWGVSISVDEQEPASGAEDAMHFGHGAILTGIMMETIGACDEVEGARSKWKPFAISLDRVDVSCMVPPSSLALAEHLRREVDAPDRSMGQGFSHSRREESGTAADVQQSERALTGDGLDAPDQSAVRRAEEQPLENTVIVALAPASEFLGCLFFVVPHRDLLAVRAGSLRVEIDPKSSPFTPRAVIQQPGLTPKSNGIGLSAQG
jgi:hypothetical protein